MKTAFMDVLIVFFGFRNNVLCDLFHENVRTMYIGNEMICIGSQV